MKVLAAVNRLMEGAVDDIDRACLLASRSQESGARLHSLPISAMDLLLEDDSLKIAVGLHLGTPLCWSNQSQDCGKQMDATSRHGLSCGWSEGQEH